MPQIVTCPDCGRKLSVPDSLLGRNVKCPGCARKFLADLGGDRDDAYTDASPRYDDEPRRRDEDDRPRPRRRDDEDDDYAVAERREVEPSKAEIRDGWQRVRTGVNLIIIAMWIVIAATVTAMVAGLFLILFAGFTSAAIFGGLPGGGPLPQAQAQADAAMFGVLMLWGVVILCFLAYVVLRITGLGFCMGVPPTRKTEGLKPLSIATFSLAVAGLVLPMMFFGANVALAQSSVAGCAVLTGNAFSGLIGLAEFICFFLFLRGVALALRQDGLAQNLVVYMIVVPIFVLVMIGAFVLIPLMGGALFFSSVNASPSPGAAVGNAAGAVSAMVIGMFVCSGLCILIGVALFGWYLMLLYQVRGALDDRLGRR